MYTTLHCIALRTVKYNDTKNILSAWSREMGRVSIMIPSGTSREARRRRALTVPLATFAAESDIRPGRTMLSVRDLRPLPDSMAIHADPVKGLTSIFLAETLDLILRQSEADDTLSDYLFETLRFFALLDNSRASANFHLAFLYHLTAPMGISPDVSLWRQGMVFDMREGIFRVTPPMHNDYLEPVEARTLAMIGRKGFATMSRWRLDHNGRNEILDLILRYYAIHLAPLTSLRSLDVLRAL